MTLFLPHHDVHAKVLVADDALQHLRETERAALPQGAREVRAFYVEADGDFVGLYASPDGSVFFAGDRRLVLQPGRDEARVHAVQGREHLFQLISAGEPWLTVSYDRPLAVPWAGDDDDDALADFYLWLAKSMGQAAFWKFWTAPLPS